MNIKSGISYGISLLLPTCGFLQACQQDPLDSPAIYDKDELIAEGRYLTARSADAFSIADANEGPQPFEVGTPYRLFAFTKPYSASNPQAETPVATNPRFNKVAEEGEITGGLRYLSIDSEPSKWFGFSALGDEEKGDEGLVSLDFYGFTYGVPADPTDSYIPVDGWQGEATQPAGLKRTETIPEGGELNDLMRGVLLNQNISTAGIESIEPNGNQIAKPNTQSVIPFNHCFSKLHFQVSQQPKKDVKDAEGNPVPSFENLVLEKIEVTGTYQTGTVSLADGKVNVSGQKIDHTLRFIDKFNGNVPLNNTDVGQMIVFPSDGNSLSNTDLGDGYKVGLKITVKSTEKSHIESMIANTGSPDGVKTETGADGVTWYKGTIVKNEIIDYYTPVGSPDRTLYFSQNTAYMLIISFQDDAVRIISVIPMIEEWLPGEGTADNPWQDQALGQPQMFDNIIWSDRNLGAEHFDATGTDYEKTVGYFYQAGRNIPYYPYKWGKGVYDATQFEKYYYPRLENIRNQDLANGDSNWSQSEYSFFPVVDPMIRSMYVHMTDDKKLDQDGNPTDGYTLVDNTGKVCRLINFQWLMWRSGNGYPQMVIPEKKPDQTPPPENRYNFNFMRGSWTDATSGLSDNQNMHWENGQAGQPTTGSWTVPSSKDFQTIFPTTPHAGNITFRKGGNNSEPMNWSSPSTDSDGSMNGNVKILRVTVPYYYEDMAAPAKTNPSAKYTEAWNLLKAKKDPGCTSVGYAIGPGGNNNPNYEPDGDPEDGFASVYLISREGDDLYEPEILKTKNPYTNADWGVKSWGTIYAIKRIYTPQAYRMRWRVLSSSMDSKIPGFYVEICRYRCNETDTLTKDNYKTLDWDHPAAKLYIPISGLGDWTGEYINFGTECQYATSDKIENGKTSAVQIKVTGNNGANCYLAVVRDVINRNFGMQIRPRSVTSANNN